MTVEQKNRLEELSNLLDCTYGEEFKRLYSEYEALNALSRKEYREREESNLKAYYEKHIEGRDFNDIDPERFDFYSDWHKDVFGYRPRSNKFNERGA